jgi:hypothetical protein
VRSILAFIVAAAATAALMVPAGAETWKKYLNGRYGTFVEYPADRFRALPEPENGDGLSFEGKDGSNLVVSGGYNVENFTPATYEKFLRTFSERDFGNVTYKMVGEQSLVLSGLRGDRVFYEKYLFAGDLIHSLVITYPRSAKAEYDAIVTRMARSLGPRSDAR